MPTFRTEMKVGNIVAEYPATARVFEKHGLDYCCGGKRTLGDACAAKRVDPMKVAQELCLAAAVAVPGDRNWSDASMTELADNIERTHHDWLRSELPRLGGLTRKVASAHGENHPELREVAQVLEDLAVEMFSHMQKEENVLFPTLRAMERGETVRMNVGEPIACMIHEHDDAGKALERMRALTNGYAPPEGACNTYRVMLDGLRQLEQDMHVHVHKENNILFPRAMERAGAMGTLPRSG